MTRFLLAFLLGTSARAADPAAGQDLLQTRDQTFRALTDARWLESRFQGASEASLERTELRASHEAQVTELLSTRQRAPHFAASEHLRLELLETLELMFSPAEPMRVFERLERVRREAKALRKKVSSRTLKVELQKLIKTNATIEFRTKLIEAHEAILADHLAAPVACDKIMGTEVNLLISGMHCAGCSAKTERVLKQIPGVTDASVSITTERARVTVTPGAVSHQDLVRTIERLEFGARILSPDGPPPNDDAKIAAYRRERRKMILSALLSAPLMVPMLLQPFGVNVMLPGWAQLLIATPTQFWIGAQSYKSAWAALKAKSANMNTLIALGTTAAYALSTYTLFQFGGGHHLLAPLYFETSSMITTIQQFSKFLESKAKRETLRDLEGLRALRPDTAIIRRGGKDIEIPTADIRVGDWIVIRPGARIAADGVVREGISQVDEALITGESLPVTKREGAQVFGGSINTDGHLISETTHVGEASALSQIIKMVEDAQASKAPIQRKVDQVAAVFVPVVVGLAALTFLGWGLVTGAWATALIHAVTVLVVSCPCAMGLATPAAIMVGTGMAANAGILIRDAEALERAYQATTIAFDKTGTLTEGRPQVSSVIGTADDQLDLMTLAASLENTSEHPYARAVMDEAKARGITARPSTEARALPGFGFEAVVDGQPSVIGNESLMRERGFDVSTLQNQARELQEAGESISYVARAGTPGVLGLIGYRDRVRPTAAAAITRLKGMGLRVVMLSGDSPVTAGKIAAELGITAVHAGLKPDDKLRLITEMKSRGEVVAMVGDGINDAPALAHADVGIAMAVGTEIAMNSSGITLMGTDLNAIPKALDLSRRTQRKIKQNLFLSLGYNVVGIPMAAAGAFNPMVAAAMMGASSILVVTNALSLRWWRQRAAPAPAEVQSVQPEPVPQM